MKIAISKDSEAFIKRMIASGRYKHASEVVRAALRRLEDHEGEMFPPGSLKHLYTATYNRQEVKFARWLRIPCPERMDK
jgi:putative addiction module CopG family antidote